MRKLELAPPENGQVSLRPSADNQPCSSFKYDVVLGGEETVIGFATMDFNPYASEIEIGWIQIDRDDKLHFDGSEVKTEAGYQEQGYGAQAGEQLIDTALLAYPSARAFRLELLTTAGFELANKLTERDGWTKVFDLIKVSRQGERSLDRSTDDVDKARDYLESHGIVQMSVNL